MMDSRTTPDLQEGDRNDNSDWKVVHRDGLSSPRQCTERKRDSAKSSRNGRSFGGSDGFEFENIVLDCAGCHSLFDFSPGEQKFFSKLGLMNQPKRCKFCRVSRKVKSNNRPSGPTTSRSRSHEFKTQNRVSWAQHPPAPPRPSRSLRPINTTLGVVVFVDRGACLVSYGDGSTVRLECSRELGVGNYVTLTRSTKGKCLRLHEVVGDSPPDDDRGTPVLLRGTVLEAMDGEMSILFQPGLGAPSSTLVCSEAKFSVSKGSVVLFSPSFRDGVLSVAATVRLTAPVSRWSNRAPPESGTRWAVAPPRMIEVLHPKSAALLTSELGVDADFRSPPSCRSPLVKHSFYDVHQSGPVPRVGLLALEEHMLLQSHSPDSGVGESVSPSDSLLKDLKSGVTGVLVATKSTGHLLAAYLRDSLEEIDALGLSRVVKVLYPVDSGVTPENIRGTVSSKLFSTRLLPITQVQVLTRPLALAQVVQATGKQAGVVRLQHFALITMVVSDASLPALPPVSHLEVSKTDLGFGPTGLTGFDSAGCGVRLLVPIMEAKSAISRQAIQEALPAGTILHTTSHSMKHSYTSYAATFPNAELADKFVGIVSCTNQSRLAPSSQWLVAPSSGFWGGTGVFTMFTTAKYDKNLFYKQFSAEWAYAVNHTQVRFRTPLSLEEVCAAADAANRASKRGLRLVRLLADGFQEIVFRKRSKARPVLRPLATTAPSASIGVSEAVAAPPRESYLVTALNVPLSAPLEDIRSMASTLAKGGLVEDIRKLPETLAVLIRTSDEDLRESFLGGRTVIKAIGGSVISLSLSPPSGNFSSSVVSMEGSGLKDLPSLLTGSVRAAGLAPGLDLPPVAPPPATAPPTSAESAGACPYSVPDRESPSLSDSPACVVSVGSVCRGKNAPGDHKVGEGSGIGHDGTGHSWYESDDSDSEDAGYATCSSDKQDVADLGCQGHAAANECEDSSSAAPGPHSRTCSAKGKGECLAKGSEGGRVVSVVECKGSALGGYNLSQLQHAPMEVSDKGTSKKRSRSFNETVATTSTSCKVARSKRRGGEESL